METAYFKNIRRQIVSLLNGAKKEVVIAMAWFTSAELFDALMDCCHRGIKVSLVLLDDMINFNPYAPDFNRLIEQGADFRLYRVNKGFMHHKFCVIDSKISITGSYNWTYYAEARNIENIFVTDKDEIAHLYKDEFFRLCRDSDITSECPRLEWEDIETSSNVNFDELNYEIEAIARSQRKPQRTVYRSKTSIEVVTNRFNPKSAYNIGIVGEDREQYAIIPIGVELPYVSKDAFPELISVPDGRANNKLMIVYWENKGHEIMLMDRNMSDILDNTDEELHLLINGNLDTNGYLHIEVRCKETGKAVDLNVTHHSLVKDED